MCYSGNCSSCQRERAAQRDTERTERDARLRETYRAEGWGKLAEIAGFDPLNTESGARMAFRFCHEVITKKDALIERLKLEAQIHAGEARAANATIGEIYQAISGATGEPGNWNGAEPVRAYVAAKDATIARLRAALEPFAVASDDLDETDLDRWPIWEHSAATEIKIADLRRARAELEASK